MCVTFSLSTTSGSSGFTDDSLLIAVWAGNRVVWKCGAFVCVADVTSDKPNVKLPALVLFSRFWEAIDATRFVRKFPADARLVLECLRIEEFRNDCRVFIGFNSYGVRCRTAATFSRIFSCSEEKSMKLDHRNVDTGSTHSKLTLNWIKSSLSAWIPWSVSALFVLSTSIVLIFSSVMWRTSHDINALSHTEWMGVLPNMSALNSVCGMASDSCVKFSMNDIAQHKFVK